MKLITIAYFQLSSIIYDAFASKPLLYVFFFPGSGRIDRVWSPDVVIWRIIEDDNWWALESWDQDFFEPFSEMLPIHLVVIVNGICFWLKNQSNVGDETIPGSCMNIQNW